MPLPIAVPIAIAAASFFKWIVEQKANSSAQDSQMGALKGAQDTIQKGGDKAIELQRPYLENAGSDYNRQRGLVQSGYYQTPYKGYQGQQRGPSGFSFNPSQGGASFGQWQPQGSPSYSPMGMPQMPAPAGLMGPGAQQQQPQQARPLPNAMPSNEQIQQMIMRSNPQAMSMPTNPYNPNPLIGYNAQTGQNNPLVGMGIKPPDPRFPSLQDRAKLLQQMPWLAGRSGPLEGGMPRGGMF